MAPENTPYGRRLLPLLIDEIAAQDPERPWVSVAKTDNLQDGFQDLSYRRFANAINRMAWWLESSIGKGQNHETLAYIGPPDVRYYVVCLVAVKVGYKAFFPSPRNSLEGHLALLNSTKCCKMLISPGTDITKICDNRAMKVVEISGMDECFRDQEAKHYHIMAAGLIGNGLATGVFLNATWVFGPTAQPNNAGKLEQMIEHGDVAACSVPPSVLEDACKYPSVLERISSLEFVILGGGPLAEWAGDILTMRTRLMDVMGSTEIGNLPEIMTDKREDWKYHRFHPRIGCRFRHHTDDLFEMVITQDDPLGPYNRLPHTFSELGEYATHDLYSRPAGKDDSWAYRGRIDDVIVLSNGEKINPVDMEHRVSKCPDVSSALVVGSGRFQPAVIIELKDDSELWHKPLLERLNTVWNSVEEANEFAPSHGKLMREYVIFASQKKPFLRLPKGTVQRRMSTQQYQEEIDKLYESMGAEDVEEQNLSVNWEDKESVEAAIWSLISHIAPNKNISPEGIFFDYGFDSMQIVKLTRGLRSAFKAVEPEVQQPELQRLIYAHPNSLQLSEALWAMLYKDNHTCEPGAQNKDVEMAQACLKNLTDELPQAKADTPIPAPQKAHVILTGSTGSLGSYLLNSLLKNKAVGSITCLNRAPNAFEKQKTSFTSRGLKKPLDRIKFLQVDFSKPKFDLPTRDYDDLLQSATHLIHNAWQVNFNLPFSYYEESHLRGVLQMIDLATASKHRAKILFTSSISTVNQWDTSQHGAVPEKPITDFSTASNMGYAQSKLVSELLLQNATAASRIDATVCRIGQIAGPARTKQGKWSLSEWLPSLIASSHELGKLPQTLGGMAQIDWVPIDVVAQAIIELLGLQKPRRAEPRLEVYHIVNPRRTTWEALLPCVRDALARPRDGDYEVVSFGEWVKALEGGAGDSNGVKLLPFYKEVAGNEPAKQTILETKDTVAKSPSLKGLKAVNEEWMRLWIRQWGLEREGAGASWVQRLYRGFGAWVPFMGR